MRSLVIEAFTFYSVLLLESEPFYLKGDGTGLDRVPRGLSPRKSPRRIDLWRSSATLTLPIKQPVEKETYFELVLSSSAAHRFCADRVCAER